MSSKKELLKELSDCVLNMENDKAAYTAEEYMVKGHPALDGVLGGLVDGMQRAVELYEEDKYFIPELLLCSDAMYSGLEVLSPAVSKSEVLVKGKVVLGVVAGDAHDIGKNLVKLLLETGGYEVFDLGRNVPPCQFIQKAIEIEADVIAVSTLMSTTMKGMAEVVERCAEAGLNGKIHVIVGGAPVTREFAEKIGADGYSDNAAEAVRLVDRLVADGRRATA